MYRAWQLYCRTLYLISKRYDNWKRRNGRTGFCEISAQGQLRRDVLYIYKTHPMSPHDPLTYIHRHNSNWSGLETRKTSGWWWWDSLLFSLPFICWLVMREYIYVYIYIYINIYTLLWRHNDHDGVWNHQPHGCLLNRLFRRRSKKTSKLHVIGLCVGNRWIPRTKGQLRGKCFHLMTSSWYIYVYIPYYFWVLRRYR